MQGEIKDVKVKDDVYGWAVRSVLFKGSDKYQDLFCDSKHVSEVVPGVEVEYTNTKSGDNLRLVKVVSAGGGSSIKTTKKQGFQPKNENAILTAVAFKGAVDLIIGQGIELKELPAVQKSCIRALVEGEQYTENLKSLIGDVPGGASKEEDPF